MYENSLAIRDILHSEKKLVFGNEEVGVSSKNVAIEQQEVGDSAKNVAIEQQKVSDSVKNVAIEMIGQELTSLPESIQTEEE